MYILKISVHGIPANSTIAVLSNEKGLANIRYQGKNYLIPTQHIRHRKPTQTKINTEITPVDYTSVRATLPKLTPAYLLRNLRISCYCGANTQTLVVAETQAAEKLEIDRIISECSICTNTARAKTIPQEA